MKSFDEWKEANLNEQMASLTSKEQALLAPTAMGKIEKAKLVGKGEGYLQRWITQMASSGPLTKQRKLSALAKVIEALGLTAADVSLLGTKIKSAIKKDAGASTHGFRSAELPAELSDYSTR
jgi:hypothetical protein